jgi:hypothetical protein
MLDLDHELRRARDDAFKLKQLVDSQRKLISDVEPSGLSIATEIRMLRIFEAALDKQNSIVHLLEAGCLAHA